MKRITILFAVAGLVLAATALPTIRANAQQNVVTDANLDQSIANAKTPSDHEAIAAFYDNEAAQAADYAKLHHSTHKAYETFKMKPTGMADHCDQLAKSYQRAADEAKALAADHRKMAKEAGGQVGQ